ncbi:MAG: hypothetical protein CL570_01690 [Alphaproteobacteria bacterium]|nr:hypothetical protein [Alphaproteobacteria bacterium]HCQ70834.1 hypothetical protein [Rhodospirillaceae bacterium]|tara:strand:+ start:9449 stop:10378 length:930 start_codon:yes stop_codon:yes gene_type:complete
MTHNKQTFVSGCDSNYFPMLLEWVHSVRAHKQSKDFDICIMNTGLTEEQCNILKPLVTHVKTPDWPCDLPEYKIRGREYLKSCVCRPFIPNLFPDYETYMWMDADMWVQDWRAIDLYMTGASRGCLSITTQSDRAYLRQIRIKWLGNLPWKVRGFYFTNALNAFGFKTAKKILPYNVLNAGSFAMRGDSPHWKRWQELLLQALKKGKIFTAEQLTLGMLTYLEDYPVEILPAWTQWLCENKPLWDEEKSIFVETFLPNEPIGIIHVSGYDEMRVDRRVTTPIKTVDGKVIDKTFRYMGYDGENQTPLSP